MCTIVPNWPDYDPELEHLRRELRRAQIEEEKARIRRELARLRGYPPFPPGRWMTPLAPICIPSPAPSLRDVLDKIPAK